MNSVRRSLWLSLANSYLGVALQLASTMIISRVLTPAEIGVFALAAVFSALAATLRHFGISEYMIQERELTNDKIAAALALNIIVSWTMATCLVAASPFVATFYANPGVARVMRVQAIAFLLLPFGAVTMAWFRRELDFRPVMICNVAGSAAAFVVSVGLALIGVGYMSLAWSMVAATAVTVALSVWFRPATFPRLPSLRGLAAVFGFSKFVSLMHIVSQTGRGAPEMIIGRAEGVVAVAMFSRGNGLVELFNSLVMRSVGLVCMPYFAKSEREGGSIAAAYVKSVGYLTAVAWPLLAFLAVAAFPVIRITYGAQWDAAVPLAQVLCLACAIEIVHVMSRDALLAGGLAKDANTLQILLAVMQVCGMLFIVPFGLIGAAWGVVAASIAGALLSQSYLSRCLGLRARELVRACAPSAAVGVIAVAPAVLWAWVEPVTPANHGVFGGVGALATAMSWLVAARLLNHPILVELTVLTRRLGTRRKA